ncbi:glycosyltransferase [Jejudonia soesokkakensis]|uniref:Glycosyltransferase n=1 Tax=Jejudonia soesokkakensis TaxID=1323432 RepID=A0ABW2MXC6_9FLAO
MLLLYVFGTIVLINCGYYLLFSKFAFYTIPEKSFQETPPVSLIICAKNEAKNLQEHLPFWLEQNHPDFEIILINDASADETLDVMEDFALKHPSIKIVNVQNNEAFWASKKYALTLGIKKASNKHLIFTDADCKPATKHWLVEMASQFSSQKELVLGYGAYDKTNGFLNTCIRYETMLTATQYFSYALAGMPYMGVGRNLGYTSSLYYANNGFISHIKVASGDDDLFVNENATSKNTAICVREESFTYSIPKNTWKKWINQKKRHITTSKLYKPKHKLLLGLFYVANLLFWVGTAVIFFFYSWEIPALIIGIRLLLQYVTLGNAAKKLKENDLIPMLPFLELFLICMQMCIFISNRPSKNPRWK